MEILNLFGKNSKSQIVKYNPHYQPSWVAKWPGISPELNTLIEQINWAAYQTAYGNAQDTIPWHLKDLFSANFDIAHQASHQLWCSLCHQHAYISSAALPAYDILKIGLTVLIDKLKAEILDIMAGFAGCTSETHFASFQSEPSDWMLALREKLLRDQDLFVELTKHMHEEISKLACMICEDLGVDIQ